MSSVSFLLKKPGSSGKSLIFLQFKYSGNKLVFSFGQSIVPKNWNRQKQRVKSNKQTTADGDHSLNDLLNNLQEVCESAYKKELKSGVPRPEVLRKHLIDFMQQNTGGEDQTTLFKLIERFINNEIKHKGRDKSPNTIKTYKTVYGHLKEYAAKTRSRVDFETIDIDFYHKYISFLRLPHYTTKKDDTRVLTRGLSQNAIAKDIQVLKVFMSEANDLGYTNNLHFRNRKFSVDRQETDAVFLTEKEVISLYRFNFSENKKLEQVRDLFVFGCFVGLRFSDYSTVKPENIVRMEGDLFIKLITQKTKDLVIIPCNPIVLEIFKKYDRSPNKLPRSISAQKFNDYLKQVCRKAGLIEKGRLATDPEKELCDCVSSHTARRSMSTNYYLQGFPTIDLMKITGHKTERAFMKYIRITKLDAAKRMNQHNKKNWSEMILRVA